MKWRMYKKHMMMALLTYQNELMRKYAYQLLTPSKLETMRMDLFEFQKKQQYYEKNPIWNVPVDIVFHPENHSIEIIITDDSNILYLDAE